MRYRRARSLTTLLGYIDEAYPHRDTTSDGWIGDTSHSRRVSDHNPDENGVVHAIDVDEDDRVGDEIVGKALWAWLLSEKPAFVKYAIYEGQIVSSYPARGEAPWTPRPYSGSNAHRSHVHVSVRDDRPFSGQKFTRPNKERAVAEKDSWLAKWPEWAHKAAKKYATKNTDPKKKVVDMTYAEWLEFQRRFHEGE